MHQWAFITYVLRMYAHFINCIYKDFYRHLNKDALEQFEKKNNMCFDYLFKIFIFFLNS